MASTRRYQYIDLGSDEIVGRRRTFKDNGLSTGRGQVDMVVQYQYIEQGVHRSFHGASNGPLFQMCTTLHQVLQN